VLEIDINNIASKRVALKAGYVLTKKDYKWEIYEYLENSKMNR
jgi:RimJ/RimL family protein N-acetyltransferase